MLDSAEWALIGQKLTVHIYQSVLFDLTRYALVVGAVFVTVIIARRLTNRRNIQSRNVTGRDVIRELLSSLRTIFVFAFVMSIIVVAEHFGKVNINSSKASISVLAYQTIFLILFHDAYAYWMHRALHKRNLFLLVHFHHHKSVAPTPLAAYSFSSLEAVLEILFAPLFLLAISQIGYSYSLDAILIFLWFMLVRNVMIHAGFEIHPKWWIENAIFDLFTTTTHHDLHHSHGNCNFGLYFTWWDRIMKTEHESYKDHFRRNSGQS